MILLDTSIIIDFLRLNKRSEFYFVFENKYGERAVSDITIAELYSGKSVWELVSRRKILDDIVMQLNNISTNATISILAGKIRAKYGTSVPDAIIAATAIENNLPLATLNFKDFENIPGLKLIKI